MLGAGIVGSCVAAELQGLGHDVVLMDPSLPGTGASYGNAGLISVDSCTPLATPGILRQLPKWLVTDVGPLKLDPTHVPRVFPWLLARVLSGRMSNVLRIADALYRLHSPALDAYRQLLGHETFMKLIRVDGQLHVSRQPESKHSRFIAGVLRQRHDIESHVRSAVELSSELPGMDVSNVTGKFYPNRGHTVNPRALVQAVVDVFTSRGGHLRPEAALKLLPRDQGGVRVISNLSDQQFDRVVVAMGLSSVSILRALSVRLPLQAERGYHMHLRSCSVPLRRPVVFTDHGFVATPMSDGLRLAGTVEICAPDAPPDERRADALLRKARELIGDLDAREASVWMGARPSTPDSLPIIDQVATCPGIMLACGHGHFGMTAAPMTAKLIGELLDEAPTSIDAKPYRLDRFSRRQASARSSITSDASVRNRSLSNA